MAAIEIARKLAGLHQTQGAIRAYALSLETEALTPEQRLEAAVYILNFGGDYRISYTCFWRLYNEGHFCDEILPLMSKVFYEPNIKLLKSRYERNVKLLSRYPYMTRRNFPPFESLPLQFFPYDENHGYVPFDRETNRFGAFVNIKDTVIGRNFFADLEKPILATDVYSQYELEYLYDNVRRSEDIGRENHIYLHYSRWEMFCSWLQVLNMRPLLEQKKIVFLIAEEKEQYPWNFKERFNLDYSQNPIQPVGIREVSRLIWHTQLSTHNGGDFFNEIFDYHPNLLVLPSMMFENVEKQIKELRETLDKAENLPHAQVIFKAWENPGLVRDLYSLKNRTDKDFLVTLYMISGEGWTANLDKRSRIAPAIFFQPHFSNIVYTMRASQSGNAVLEAKNVEAVHNSGMFKNFKYIKTFTPMRRFTTSHGATVRFMDKMATKSLGKRKDKEKFSVVSDAITERITNRSFLMDPEDRLYRDSVIVRFEDGKLNPRATFTALAAFLDLPYTDTMTYCSEQGKIDPVSYEGNELGFSLAAVYRTYDDYVNDNERRFIEYFLRDAYEFYGYDFHYYDGKPMDNEKVNELIFGFNTIDHYMRKTWRRVYETVTVSKNGERIDPEQETAIQEKLLDNFMNRHKEKRIANVHILQEGLRFISGNGQPLRFIPLLPLDPKLLEKPLYR